MLVMILLSKTIEYNCILNVQSQCIPMSFISLVLLDSFFTNVLLSSRKTLMFKLETNLCGHFPQTTNPKRTQGLVWIILLSNICCFLKNHNHLSSTRCLLIVTACVCMYCFICLLAK